MPRFGWVEKVENDLTKATSEEIEENVNKREKLGICHKA
jgi:hypothetical protein